MDDLAWLRLQVEWGADEALEERPVDRRQAATPDRPRLLPPRAPAMPSPPAPLAGPAGVAQARALAQAAPTIAALHAAVAGFEGCALRATATNLVFGAGEPGSPVVLVVDVPGAAEDRAGMPLAGPAAAFFDRMLASAGLDRATWRTVSLLPWRPPGDRKPTDMEVQLCLPFLQRHLELLQPRRVVLLGGLAARSLLPNAGKRGRGAWHDLAVAGVAAPVPTLALPTLGHIQATPMAKRDAWAALLRLRRAIDADHDDHG